MSGFLLQSTDHRGIATLTLNRAEIHNAFNDDLISDLSSALEALGADEHVRAVILTGNGASFCAGADLNWMRRMAVASREENRDDALRLAALLRRLNYFPKPTIARVNGTALGGGVGLISCCDIVITSESAKFGLTEARLGLVPAVIAPYVYRKIGESAARHYFVSAGTFNAATARRIGLVHSCVPLGDLDSAIEHHVELLMKTGPNANYFAKKLVFSVAGHDENKQQQIDQVTAEMIAELRLSQEGQEGVKAFLEKRAADWSGKT